MAYTLPRLTARPGSFGRRATGEDLGAAEGAARVQGAGVVSELAEASGRILSAREGSRAARALSEASLEMEQQVEALRDDPDEATYEERFEKARADIRSRYSQGLFGAWQGDFEERFEIAGAQAAGRVRDLVRAKRVAAGRADSTAALGNWSNLYARAGELDRPEIMAQAAAEIGRGVGSGLFSAEQGQAALEQFKAQATEGLWRAGKNQDPEGTLEDLRARRGGFEHMDEARRQAAIEAVEGEIQQRERFAAARVTEARVQAERAQRELEEKTTKDLLFAAAQGTLTVDQIQANRENLSASTVSQLLNATKREFNPEAVPEPVEYFRLRMLAATDPAAFAAEKIDPARVGFNKALSLIDAQAAARKKDPVVTGDNFEGRWARRIADMKGLDKEEQAQLFRIGEARVQEFQERTGNRPGPKEEQEIIDQVLLQNTARRRNFFGFSQRVVVPDPDVPAGEPPAAVEGVPQQYLPQIAEALRKAGKPVTDAAILERYQAAKARGLVK